MAFMDSLYTSTTLSKEEKMTKPDIKLEHGKGVVSEMASRIFAAYIIRGEVKEGEESSWMERSIREAVKIAKTIDASIDTEKDPEEQLEKSATSAANQKSKNAKLTKKAEEAPTESELEDIIDEALSAEDVMKRKKE
jgi:hypothetical protein